MKKLIPISIVVLCLVGGGIWTAEHMVRQKVANQVVDILNNPSTEQQINQLVNGAASSSKAAESSLNKKSGTKGTPSQSEASGHSAGSDSGSTTGSTAGSAAAKGSGSNAGSSSTGGNSAGSSSTPDFTSRQQVVQYAMSHFTQSEIAHYTYLYLHRSSLRSSEKAAIKAQILSRFTPQELQAMESAVHKNS